MCSGARDGRACDTRRVSPADAPPQVDHTALYRGILVIGTIAVPVFGLLEWDLQGDSFTARLIFAGAALVPLVASYRSAALRRRLRLAPLLLCYGLFAWFVYIGWRHGMVHEDALGLLPIVVGATVVIRRAWEIAVFAAFAAGSLALAYRFVDAPRVPLSVTLAVILVFTGILGGMSVWRTRLEEALAVANATLEARVAERTAMLAREVAERVAAEQRANAASEAKSRFLANMSHELRTPLNAVIGYTELVEHELADTEQAHHCADLAKVGQAARHLLTIIDDILDISRVESGSLIIRRERVAVRPAVDDAAVVVQPAIAARGNRLTIDVDDLEIAGDRAALTRVLVHLLDNAAKFTSRGAITITARRSGDELALAVRDTGVGIPAPAMQHIFQKFTQADDSSTRLHGGAGLGLALCKALVERMGGTIAVDSEVGRGSTFTIRLPIV
jgi:signal transduction histidine kinase